MDLILTDPELAQARALTNSLADRFQHVENQDFLCQAAVHAWQLPQRLTSFVDQVRLKEVPAFRVRGWRVDDREIGPTPTHWGQGSRASTAMHEFLLVLFASLLGDVISFAAVQDGQLITHVLPVRGAETSVTAGSSESTLEWHTEGAGLACRVDYQAFLCLRNPDQVPTLIASLDPGQLPRETLAVLRQPRFEMPAPGPDGAVTVRLAAISGRADRPYLRLDPVYLHAVSGDEEAANALAAVNAVVSASLKPFEQDPGDLCVIDNYLLVHGRPSFTPRYDGSDRWLLRAKIARDLRRSAAYRANSSSRLVLLRR